MCASVEQITTIFPSKEFVGALKPDPGWARDEDACCVSNSW